MTTNEPKVLIDYDPQPIQAEVLAAQIRREARAE
jgi:hypothetical protein